LKTDRHHNLEMALQIALFHLHEVTERVMAIFARPNAAPAQFLFDNVKNVQSKSEPFLGGRLIKFSAGTFTLVEKT